jgi:hypothetical protein
MNNARSFHIHAGPGFILCALAALTLATACSDNATSPTSPSSQSNIEAPRASFGLVSDTVVAQPVSYWQCPFTPPYAVPFIVFVDRNGDPALSVTEFQLRFTDTFGMSMPTVTLPAPVPTTEFGSALSASRGDLRFPLSLSIGCGVGRTGTISVHFNTRDGRGRIGSGRLNVSVR